MRLSMTLLIFVTKDKMEDCVEEEKQLAEAAMWLHMKNGQRG